MASLKWIFHEEMEEENGTRRRIRRRSIFKSASFHSYLTSFFYGLLSLNSFHSWYISSTMAFITMRALQNSFSEPKGFFSSSCDDISLLWLKLLDSISRLFSTSIPSSCFNYLLVIMHTHKSPWNIFRYHLM